MKDAMQEILSNLKEKAIDSEFTAEKSRFVEYVDSLEDKKL